MSREMKYVVVESEAGEQLFTFPKTINHDRFAEILSNIREGYGREWKHIFRTPVSAGFTDGETCYGRSASLGLDSRPIDTALLKTEVPYDPRNEGFLGRSGSMKPYLPNSSYVNLTENL